MSSELPPNDTENLQPTDAAAEPAAAAEPSVADLQAALVALQARNNDLTDQHLRAQADMQNTRRRAEEEVAKARKFALESFAESLLPVCDSLEAAIALPDASQQQMLEGVHATLRQLNAALERNKVLPINPPAGTKFDPHQHQAISMVPSEQEANTVVSVLQKGYSLHDRVLRPALVTVAKPPSDPISDKD